ncbi:MFS transporter [Paraglaciecola arctica]|uniref:MFS transporter n=1 Tax=Paraglaciecola arctica TaxID=1128911 RepID=UPI001C077279|nr:MFS transporter [Paraglaciecola arctica]
MFSIPDISRQHKMALGFGFLAVFFANHSLSAMAIPYFQMTLGLDPFKLSLVMAGPIVFAALISQTVGEFSDRTNNIRGSRRFILMLSGVLSGLCFSLIWMVPIHWEPDEILYYLLLLNSLFCISMTFLTINVKSLAFELSHDAQQRVKVMAFGSLFERLGTLAYFWLFPIAQLSLWGGVYLGIQYVGWFIGFVLIALFAAITAWFSEIKSKGSLHHHSDKNTQLSLPESNMMQPIDTTQMDHSVKRALFLLLGLTLIKFGLISIFTSLDFYLLVYFVKAGDLAAGAAWKGILSSSFACVTLVMIPLFSYLTLKLGKLKTLYLIYWITALGAILKWFIFQPGNEWAVVVDALLGAPSWVAISVIIPSMFADLCAYERRLSGKNKVGYVISIQNKVINLGLVGAMIGAGLLLNIVGFDADLAGQQHANTITWMRVCLAGGPLLLCFVSLFIVKIYPLSEPHQTTLNAKSSYGQT